MGITVAITGGAGFIGSNLARRLLSLGHSVIIIDDLSAGQIANLPSSDRIMFYQADIRDESTRRIYRDHSPEVLFHLAAHFANERSIVEPEENLQVNTLGTLIQLKLAMEAGISRFVFASTSCVYTPGQGPLDEESPLLPHTPYGISKLAGEHYCRFFSCHYGLPITILRYFNVYGPLDCVSEYRGVIPRFMDWAARGIPLSICGNGQETRDYTYVSDAVSATVQCAFLDEAIGETFNVGTGKETSLAELAGLIRPIAGFDGMQLQPRRSWDNTGRRLASIEKARRILGYQPEVSLPRGLRMTWDWLQAEQLRKGRGETTPVTSGSKAFPAIG